MEEDVALHNVDVMTDVSMPATAFTRYTVAPTSASRSSRWGILILMFRLIYIVYAFLSPE
jgi:hypothetical protein